jgi:hypothetical protein
MNTIFTISQLERSLLDGVVTTVYWTAAKTDGNYTASIYGAVVLPAKDPSDPTFVAYEDITEAQALEWVDGAMDETEVKALETNLAAQIDAHKAPAIAIGVPWLAPAHEAE